MPAIVLLEQIQLPRGISRYALRLDLTAREVFVSGVSKYQFSRRDSEIPDVGEGKQARETIGIFYTLLGHDRFGMGEGR